MHGAWNPDRSFGDEAVEESAGGRTDVVTAFRVPLDAENKVGGGAFRSLAAFNGLDNGVLRAACGNPESVAGNSNRLMVAGVDGQAKEVVLLRRFLGGEKGAETRFRRSSRSVGDGDLAPSRVIDRENGKILHERPATPDVQNLDTEADSKERLVEIVSILEKKLIDIARLVGYESDAAFSKAFKRVVGSNPSEYLKRGF